MFAIEMADMSFLGLMVTLKAAAVISANEPKTTLPALIRLFQIIDKYDWIVFWCYSRKNLFYLLIMPTLC